MKQAALMNAKKHYWMPKFVIIIPEMIQMLNEMPYVLEYDSWEVLTSSALKEKN